MPLEECLGARMGRFGVRRMVVMTIGPCEGMAAARVRLDADISVRRQHLANTCLGCRVHEFVVTARCISSGVLLPTPSVTKASVRPP